MTAQGEDVLAWLDSAIRVHEDAARAAGAEGTPYWGEDSVFYGVRDTENGLVVRTWGGRTASVQHIGLNDPATILRRCAGDRKLLELHGGRGHSCPAYDYDGDLDEYARFYNHEVCPVVQHLADGYGWTAGQTSPSKGDQVT